MAEVAVDALGIAGGEWKLAHGLVGGDVDHAQDGGVAVLNKDDVLCADGLGGVDFGAGGGVVFPQDFLVRGDQGDAELVGEEDVPVGQKNSVADFTFAIGDEVTPDDFPFSYDEHVVLFLFAGVEEIVLGEPVAG